MKKRGEKRVKIRNINLIAILIIVILLGFVVVDIIPKSIEEDEGLSSLNSLSWFSKAVSLFIKPECSDGRDNDADGYCDYTGCYIGRGGNRRWLPRDPDCINKQDNKEATDCIPSSEICDGRDNDCDGSIDESLTRVCSTTCGSGIEICMSGTWQNCNAPQPPANYGEICSAGIGECRAYASTGCDGQCSAIPGTPSSEICDGKDNDCDGTTDEGLVGCEVEQDWPMFKQNLRHTGYTSSNAPNTNNLLWKVFTNTTRVSNAEESSPVVENNIIYVGRALRGAGVTTGVIAINATSKEIIWNYVTGGEGSSILSTPAVEYGRVYFGSNFSVYSLNKYNGELIWKYTTGGLIIGSATLYDDKVYIASFDGNLYALNATTTNPNGELIWKTPIGDIPHSTPAIADNIVCVGSGSPGWGFGLGKNFSCLNAQNGNVIWKMDMGGGVYSSPAIVNEIVYFNSDSGYVYAFNLTTGGLIWRYEIGPNGASPSIAFGRIFTVNDMSVEKTLYGKRYVYALNAISGSLIWRYDITKISPTNNQSNNPKSSPAVSADGKVCLGVDGKGDYWAPPRYQNGSIICLNATTNNPNGELIWEYKVGEGVYVDTSPAIVDNIMYIAASDGYLYAFG